MAASRLQDFRDDAWCKIIGAFEFLQNSAHIIRERYSRTSCWLPDADFTGQVNALETKAGPVQTRQCTMTLQKPLPPLQTCIVTGGNAGCGLAIARELYMRGGHVILACRSRERGFRAAQASGSCLYQHLWSQKP